MPSSVARIWSYLQGAVRSAPWIHLAVLPPALAVTISWAASATPAEQAAAWSIATVLGTLAAGLVKRPLHVAVSSAAITTVVGDLAVLGLHLPASASAAALAFASLVSPAASQLAPSRQAQPLQEISWPPVIMTKPAPQTATASSATPAPQPPGTVITPSGSGVPGGGW